MMLTKLKTLLTMLIAVWAYGTIWGIPFAVGFILLIFVHELGHGLVMRQQGIPAGAPVFIPFVGAVIAMKGMPRDAYVEALVGIGGPALGTLGDEKRRLLQCGCQTPHLHRNQLFRPDRRDGHWHVAG
jgi:Zn-dependent protease